MDAVTYPQQEVIRFVNGRLIPLKLPHDAAPHASELNVQWTPTLLMLDPTGKEHHRSVGFLPPEELLASLRLGLAKCDFDAGRFDAAVKELEDLLGHHADSDAAPEAIYYRGVARYKGSGDPLPLKAAYELLATQHPNSEWTKRAYPYRLL